MKYKAVEKNNTWHIGTKKYYYTQMKFDSKEKASEYAIIKELQEHYDKAHKLFTVLEKMNPAKYDEAVPMGDNPYKSNFGDLVC